MNFLRNYLLSTGTKLSPCVSRQLQCPTVTTGHNLLNTRSMSSQDKPERVLHDATKQEFYLEMGGERAKLQYSFEDGVYDLYHTFTPPSFRGSGIAKVLAYRAFDYVVDSGAKMKLTCTYLEHVNNKDQNPKYLPHVVKSSSM